jgi:hypothetical protein
MNGSISVADQVGEIALPDNAADFIESALAQTSMPLCTPEPSVRDLRQKIVEGARFSYELLRSQTTAPTPGDAALAGTLVRLVVPRHDIVISGNAHVPLDQSVFPARGQVIVPGSMEVKGNLHVVAPLVVCGDLIVSGSIRDCGPQSVIVVLGHLRCRSLCTTGEVLVSGDLVASTFVWGRYNDNVLEVHGTLRTAVLMSDDHAIEAGEIEVEHSPKEPGVWGDETFDMGANHQVELKALLTDASCAPDGEIDIERLAEQVSPWIAPV